MKKLWRALHGVLGESRADDTTEHTADDFATFFNDKVVSVRASPAATPLYEIPYSRDVNPGGPRGPQYFARGAHPLFAPPP